MKTIMKGLLKSSGWLVMAAALSFGFASCSSDNDAVAEQQSVKPTGKYTMTVQVTKGDADTRALKLGEDDQGKPIVDAYWSGNEKIDVVSFVGEQLKVIGTATAAASPNGATTLTATLTDAPSMRMFFYLGGHDMTWTGQVGLLTGANSISEKYDYAIGGLRSSDYTIVGSNIIPNEYASVEFLPQQAIVKFTLVDKANGEPINATSLTFHCGDQSRLFQSYNPMTGQVVSGDVTITPITPSGTTNVIYASLAQVSDCPLTLTATVGDDTYIYDKDEVSFTHGTYNEVTVKMEKAAVTDLSKLKAENLTQNENDYYEYVAQNGEILTGKLGEKVKISIANGATVTLDNVTINGANLVDRNDINYPWGGITCEGNVTIILKGANTVKGFYRNYPGIHVPDGSALTIEGTGSLDASSNGFGAGIGGGYGVDCGDIVINGGTITAEGGDYCAGIGSGGDDSSWGTITINGGTIKATGGDYGAGIGSGGYIEINDEEEEEVDDEPASSCGAITINRGTITAKGGDYAAGIGSGAYSLCESITIENTVTRVTAEKGYGDGDCIGAGDNGNCAEVVIGGEEGYIEESPYTYVPASGGQGEDTD